MSFQDDLKELKRSRLHRESQRRYFNKKKRKQLLFSDLHDSLFYSIFCYPTKKVVLDLGKKGGK